jgi:predicted deacylase
MISDLAKLGKMVEQDSPLKGLVEFETLTEINYKGDHFPIYSFTIGSKDPTAPTLFITGGVHGIERVGAQLAWSLLKTTLDRILWDKALQEMFTKIRLVFIPLVNPVGYAKFKRCNGNDVDLMRNAPVVAVDKTHFLLGGQRLSRHLPWYQGKLNVLEEENNALYIKFFKSAKDSRCVISVDFHSGFGMKDRLWFPFSYTKEPFHHLPEMHAFNRLFDETYPYHIYRVEPQSKGYLLNGDVWDYFYLKLREQNPDSVYLPLTLEMGSWIWVKKNPLQLFSKQGIFNPIKEHRLKRTYRRHNLLFDFLLKSLYSHEVWSNLDTTIRQKHIQSAKDLWYV